MSDASDTAIKLPTMGAGKRLVVGFVCAIISLSVLYGILLLLEHFKAKAPEHAAVIRRTQEAERDLEERIRTRNAAREKRKRP